VDLRYSGHFLDCGIKEASLTIEPGCCVLIFFDCSLILWYTANPTKDNKIRKKYKSRFLRAIKIDSNFGLQMYKVVRIFIPAGIAS
jgi:bacillopeptidase F (M6 metalloprotease family)